MQRFLEAFAIRVNGGREDSISDLVSERNGLVGTMKLCRLKDRQGNIRIGEVRDNERILEYPRRPEKGSTLEQAALELGGKARADGRSGREMEWPSHKRGEVTLLAPVDYQEVWAAGVTYLRSKSARMEESDFSASAYDRVYEAARPELFFKAQPEKVVGPWEAVGIRHDADWSVPEPELAIFLSSGGEMLGCTIGNDMSSRDIEGENLLYLPQAKVYDRSCALGPFLALETSEAAIREWEIHLRILRGETVAVELETRLAQIKRPLSDLIDYLFRCQRFPNGVILLTGTGLVPPDDFTLQEGDRVQIDLSGVGQLENPVVVV